MTQRSALSGIQHPKTTVSRAADGITTPPALLAANRIAYPKGTENGRNVTTLGTADLPKLAIVPCRGD